MATDTSRYRTQLTQIEAIELSQILESQPDLSLAMMRVASKLRIFVASIQQDVRQPAYVPVAKQADPLKVAARKAAQETDPRKVLYHELLDDPEVSEELKNTLMSDAIFDNYPTVDPRTGKSVISGMCDDQLDINEDSI